MREVHCCDLPWPRDVLAELGTTPVRPPAEREHRSQGEPPQRAMHFSLTDLARGRINVRETGFAPVRPTAAPG
jgi:hypothetical protein